MEGEKKSDGKSKEYGTQLGNSTNFPRDTGNFLRASTGIFSPALLSNHPFARDPQRTCSHSLNDNDDDDDDDDEESTVAASTRGVASRFSVAAVSRVTKLYRPPSLSPSRENGESCLNPMIFPPIHGNFSG